jgi:hypothetical protein
LSGNNPTKTDAELPRDSNHITYLHHTSSAQQRIVNTQIITIQPNASAQKQQLARYAMHLTALTQAGCFTGLALVLQLQLLLLDLSSAGEEHAVEGAACSDNIL